MAFTLKRGDDYIWVSLQYGEVKIAASKNSQWHLNSPSEALLFDNALDEIKATSNGAFDVHACEGC